MVLQEYLYFLKRKPNVLVANGAAPSCKKTKQNLPYYMLLVEGHWRQRIRRLLCLTCHDG